MLQALYTHFTEFNTSTSHINKCYMFPKTFQTAGGAKGGQNTVPITLSIHAQERWAERTPNRMSLKTAWEQSVPVIAPEADSTAARLYPPYNALLLVQHTTVTTVLNNDGRLDTPGLAECPGCGDYVDPEEDEDCPWCGADCSDVACVGSVAVGRGGI